MCWRDRMQEPGRLQNMIAVSSRYTPGDRGSDFRAGGLLSHPKQDPATVMTISLGGGGEGPRNGGLTPIERSAPGAGLGQRPPDVKRPKRSGRCAKTPEMTMPAPKRQGDESPRRPPTPVKRAPTRRAAATPNTRRRGNQRRQARSPKRARVARTFGLSTGGGARIGSVSRMSPTLLPRIILNHTMRIRIRAN